MQTIESEIQQQMADYLREEERELARFMRNGNENSAMKEMIRLFKRRSISLQSMWGYDRDSENDLFTDTLCTVWQKRRNYNPSKGSIRAWFFQIYRNKKIDSFRKQKKIIQEIELAEATQSTPEFQELKCNVRRLLTDNPTILTDQQRYICLSDLYWFPGKNSCKKLAEELGTTEQTIKSQRSKAYNKLAQHKGCDLRAVRKLLVRRERDTK